MRLFKFFSALVLLAAAIGSAAAEVPRAAVREMLERDGTVARYVGQGDGVRDYLLTADENSLPFPADLIPEIADLMGEIWDGRPLLEALEIAYAEHLSPDDLKTINAFLDTPLAKRAAELEVAAATNPAIQAEIEANEAELAASLQADKGRMAVFQRIDKAQYVTELTAAVDIALLTAMVTASADEFESIAEIEQILAAMRPQIIEDSRIGVMASFARVYRDLSLTELQIYADVFESDAGRVLNAAYFSVATDYFAGIGRRTGEAVRALLKQKRS